MSHTNERLADVSACDTQWHVMAPPELHDQIVDSIRQILRAVVRMLPFTTHVDLADGMPGIALLLAYARRCGITTNIAPESILERCLDTLSCEKLGAGLFHGFTGLAWALSHLSEPRSPVDCDEIDCALIGLLERVDVGVPFDLMEGVSGIGVYALERPSNSCTDEMVQAVLSCLAKRSTGAPLGTFWALNSENSQQLDRIDSVVDFGMAHGIGGVIAVLARVVASQRPCPAAAPMLERAVSWLLSHEQRKADHSAFPGISRWPEFQNCFAGWCYGDVGLSCALAAAATATGNTYWKQRATDIGLASLLSNNAGGLRDTSLCHGTAGLALMSMRLYHATGVDGFRLATELWIRETLLLLNGQNRPGFSTLQRDASGQLVVEESPGLLCGAAGVGLMFLASVTSIRPDWDRCLALST